MGAHTGWQQHTGSSLPVLTLGGNSIGDQGLAELLKVRPEAGIVCAAGIMQVAESSHILHNVDQAVVASTEQRQHRRSPPGIGDQGLLELLQVRPGAGIVCAVGIMQVAESSHIPHTLHQAAGAGAGQQQQRRSPPGSPSNAVPQCSSGLMIPSRVLPAYYCI